MSTYTQTPVIQCVEHATQRACAALRADMRRGVTSLASVAATASFVGFFGTVLGIMNSFQSIGTSKSAALAGLTGRLSDALVPGILGLFVAVMAFCFHQYLSNQLEAIDLEMDNASLDLTNRLVVHLEQLRVTNPAPGAASNRNHSTLPNRNRAATARER